MSSEVNGSIQLGFSQDNSATPANPPVPNEPKNEKRGSLVIAPVPISSPTVGSGAILVAGYVFHLHRCRGCHTRS